jgi:uncharacterized protein (UPF0303 family)
MHELFSSSLKDLENLEGDNITLDAFNSDIAWAIGSATRKIAIEKYGDQSLVIDITLSSGQVLFHTCTNGDAELDNDEWVNRKKRTVLRFGKSSFYMGQKLRIKGKSIEDALYISPVDYATHGGSVPIRIKNFDGVVGTLTISGLAQEQDHLLAIDVLQSYREASA